MLIFHIHFNSLQTFPNFCSLKWNVFSTGNKIFPVQWDTNRQRAINSKRFPYNTELNIWLDKIDGEIKSMFRGFHIDNVSPNADLVRNQINERIFKKTSSRITSYTNNGYEPIQIFADLAR